jgi:hypothetical protein
MQIKQRRRKPIPKKPSGRAGPRRAHLRCVAVVGSLEEARAALAGARAPVLFVSPPGSAASLGLGYFSALVEAMRAEFPQIAIDAVIDCGDEPGRALAALRMGFKIVALRGHPRARAAVAAIARALGARLLRHAPRAS